MSKINKLVVGVAAVAFAGYILSLTRQHRREKILRLSADEGYETAHDVLFPKKLRKARHLRYGPVLPH
ncbi:MAG: hypothetical protein ABJA37_09360 [Ferruginibacter sp.]